MKFHFGELDHFGEISPVFCNKKPKKEKRETSLLLLLVTTQSHSVGKKNLIEIGELSFAFKVTLGKPIKSCHIFKIKRKEGNHLEDEVII